MKQTFKEYLKPAGQEYSEGPMSLVTHNGILYKLDIIFHMSKDLPVTMVPLSELLWMLNSIEPGSDDEKRVKKVDKKVPIIVTPQNGQYVIIDGYHRALKAQKDGDKDIPARIIFHDVLAMSKLGSNVAYIGNQGDLNPYLESAEAADPAARMMELAGRLKMIGGQLGKKRLQGLIADRAMTYNVTKAKSVWAGKMGKATSPEGMLFYISPDGDKNWHFEFDEAKLKAAGTSVEELKQVLKALKLKRDASLYQMFA